jgi:hypothetical protein
MKTRTPSHEVLRVVGSGPDTSPLSSRRPRGSKEIVILFPRTTYPEVVRDKDEFKKHIDRQYMRHPELFPEAMKQGYQLNGFTEPSRKLGVIQRRILIKETKEVFTIKPSFVMPYMTGYTETIEKGLLLVKYKVPFWVISLVLGKDAMYWWRAFVSLGRNSLVGTTVKDPENIPKDINADEKKTRMNGKEINIATTVGEECLLGAAICTDRREEDLKEGYHTFKEEAQNVNPDYTPDSVTTDGSSALRNAFKSLFPNVILILCYLHSVLSIKKRSQRLGVLFQEIMNHVWHVYHAQTKRAFSQRIRRLKEWAIKNVDAGVVLNKILRLCEKSPLFQVFYDHPSAHRTSNMIDRLMDRQDRFLYLMKYFHGHFISAELGIRAWAILMNFGPYCPRATDEKGDWICAAQKLNGFRYSDNWLENLLISSSMNGYRR